MPPKLGFIEKSRAVIDLWLLRLSWPNVNPDFISYLALPISLAFVLVWSKNELVALIILMFVLILDWLDGIVAKKFGRACEHGWVIDVATDRISEGIIFIYFFHPWFYLFLLNILLTVFSYKFKKYSLILPLRHMFFLYLILYFSFYYFFTR